MEAGLYGFQKREADVCALPQYRELVYNFVLVIVHIPFVNIFLFSFIPVFLFTYFLWWIMHMEEVK